MAFLFKSKKHQSNLPPGARDIHTSDGSSASSQRPTRENGYSTSGQSPTPSSSVNNSLNSLGGGGANSPDQQWPQRSRSESESIGTTPRSVVPAPPVNPPNASLYPWSQRRLNFPTPQQNPFPRYGAAVNAVASKEGDIYMMGGLISGSMVKGDLWIIEAGGGNISCYPIATISEGPGPRVGHASLLVGNAFIVFGGDTKMDDHDTLDDTLYLLNTSSRSWSRAGPPGQRPAGRYGHTLNILGSKLYVFGGQVEGYFFNDLIAFDLNALQNSGNKWEFLVKNTQDTEDDQVPPARTNHSVVSYNDKLYLFGGTNGSVWFNDVWTFEARTNVWTQLDCIGYIPAPREGHSAALVNDVMYIFGGRTEQGEDLGDLAAFRITSKRWYTFQNMGPSPSPRSGHSMTAFGKQVIVLAGEPSSAPRDTGELSLSYVLDTAKIRYPNDAASQGGTNQALEKRPPSRQPSGDNKTPIPPPLSGARSVSREGQNQSPSTYDAPKRVPSLVRENPAPSPIPNSGQISGGPGANNFGSRLPRASIAQAPSGPPPQGQAPTPKSNGAVPVVAPAAAPRSRTPTRTEKPHTAQLETVRAVPPEKENRSPVSRESPKEAPLVRETSVREIPVREAPVRETPVREAPVREPSPPPTDRRPPTRENSNSRLHAKALEAGEAAPLVHGGPARQRSLRTQRQHSSMDSTEEPTVGRSNSSSIPQTDGNHENRRHSRNFGDEPRSPRLNPHQEALIKELDSAKSKNAWYASELAQARKNGYQPNSNGPIFELDGPSEHYGDEDRPLIDALVMMKTELAKMQSALDMQTSSTAKRMAEVEHQRDTAITEAVYARAKLAAHGGSQRSTPQPDNASQDEINPERSTDMSRRLALALAAHSEHKSKIESLTNEIQAERRAREIAEETAETAQRRLAEISNQHSGMEIESLKVELHEAQGMAREEAAEHAEADASLRMLQVDKEELTQRLEEAMSQLQNHSGTLGGFRDAVSASSEKAQRLERQLEQERTHREGIERKLFQLRSEHEERTSELETTSRRLRDAEELAESHAREAETHRQAVLTGLEKGSTFDADGRLKAINDKRLATVQQQAEQAKALAKTHQAAADAMAEKLRRAEERIAGLEAYQEQTSREGLGVRKQLQSALKEVQSLTIEHRDIKSQFESHQRDTSALVVQHGALKDLLGERGVSASDARRSPMFESPGSRFGTPEQSRLRELEQQLQASMKAHEDTRSTFESSQQEADRAYREKLEQLENDYQSAVHYVKGTEKMLKRMKDELSKYKIANARLQTELDSTQKPTTSERALDQNAPADWESERQALQKNLNEIQERTNSAISSLESQLESVRSDLHNVQSERDAAKAENDHIQHSARQQQANYEALKHQNTLLETRAFEAEQKVTMLLDQVETSVVNYRRQSQQVPQANGMGHIRQISANSVSTAGHQRGDSMSESNYTGTEGGNNRNSMALDSLASELDALRSHWETTTKNYRLSSQFDFEKTPTTNDRGELSDSLASWRKRLDEEEEEAVHGK